MTTSTLNTVRNIRLGSYWYKAEFTPEVTGMKDRLHNGDGTVGWLGDSTLSLHLAVEGDARGRPVPGGQTIWQVWGRTADGQDYVCLNWPVCDASLLRALAERDVRTQNMVALIEKENRANEARIEAERREKFEELADKSQWALRKDVGHLEGGTHRFTQVDGLRDKK